jgi:hypothetical protein
MMNLGMASIWVRSKADFWTDHKQIVLLLPNTDHLTNFFSICFFFKFMGCFEKK